MLKSCSDPPEFAINENFLVAGVGIVVSGVVTAGTIKVGTNLLLGPDKANSFKTVQVKGLHKDRVTVEEAIAGEMCCLNIKPTNRKEILTRGDFRKGMMLIDPSLKTDPVWEFDADVIVCHHATQVEAGYNAVAHCGIIRQAAKVLKVLPTDVLIGGKRGLLRMRFLCFPEYLKANSSILFREGEIKMFGIVTKVYSPKETETTQTNATTMHNSKAIAHVSRKGAGE
eukprot:CAMPEP_0176454490 /NCGR_PEP_ID=MMETSP0127-20121128/29989_1 /TAXON_ID=938130 /ORGANISM="Platyophrya macrostoma, Strain WH" /LENGTH=226 /DNA_ID=CAMNT_0017843799 /DNA_START=193 /DNA_END=870 /DNA_ORIENTATION=-